jgi:hypothetical protein
VEIWVVGFGEFVELSGWRVLVERQEGVKLRMALLLHIFRCSICRHVQSFVVVGHAWSSSYVRCLVKGARLRARYAVIDACSLW